MSLDHKTANPLDSRTVLVVIPTYNERDNIASLIEELLALGERYRVLVVDDSSPDGTASVVSDLGQAYPGRVDLLSRPTKEGIGRAYVAGFRRALSMDIALIAQMDADHSHQPPDLARLVARADENDVDLVLASRYIEGGATLGWPWHRKLISRAGGVYAGAILGVGIKDLTGGFKVWRRTTLEAIKLDSIHSDGYCFQIETTYRALRKGFRIEQVPITFIDRVAGKSKLSRRVVLEAAVVVWQLRFRQLLGRRW
ncbi:MAG: Glycosyl transferase, group 2 family protein [uncultured Thermomicrobiales bacterium]|uniref:Glycosyl transferase, group 2 family protein n=1 Tax=uncultured Thermomicrobiales bacterium TaxID=1645740 RepID=A0A6J4UPX7_9BACT|nr:MAG: Glycosyl transferase, group 2 family protein [uncultured Thermomicrobiales bacterium]